MVGSDLTLAKIPKSHINSFFQVRHLIQARSGVSKGIVITALETHTLFGIDKNLRTSFCMFIKSIPTNPHDRSLLKRYIDPILMNHFERSQAPHPELAIYWHPSEAPNGILTRARIPPQNIIVDMSPTAPSFNWLPIIWRLAIGSLMLWPVLYWWLR